MTAPTGIVQQVAHNLVQVLFALNEVYFSGEGQLDVALAHLLRQPPKLYERIRALLWPGTPDTTEVLREQRDSLRSLLAEVRDIAAHPGDSQGSGGPGSVPPKLSPVFATRPHQPSRAGAP